MKIYLIKYIFFVYGIYFILICLCLLPKVSGSNMIIWRATKDKEDWQILHMTYFVVLQLSGLTMESEISVKLTFYLKQHNYYDSTSYVVITIFFPVIGGSLIKVKTLLQN